MKLVIVKNKKEAMGIACAEILKLISKKPNAVLGLATGGTMVSLYKRLAKLYKNKRVDFSEVRTFNLDEYAGIKNPEENKNSYHTYMKKNLFSKVNIKKKNINFPSGSENYESKIMKSGGIDLCMLGIGRNGHIAFNEPGSSFKSETRKIKLTENTRKANSRFFRNKSNVPTEAYTMGIQTIMRSKKIILIALGKEKSEAVRRSVKEKITEDVPASVLQRHKDATLVLDSRAAERL